MLSKRDMRDYMIASAIFACGQPEDFYKSLTMIEEIFQQDLEVNLIDPCEVPDERLICQVFHRAGGGVPEELKKHLTPYSKYLEARDWTVLRRGLRKAVRELSRYLDEDFYTYVACCTSPSQGIIPMYVSAVEGKVCLDGDCCGRALQGVAPYLCAVAGVSGPPMTMVTPFDETVILKSALDERRALDIVNSIHFTSGSWALPVAGYVARMKDYRRAIVPNISSALIKIGRAVRIAREEGENPVEAFLKATKGYKLFKGEVKSFEHRHSAGYVEGTWTIRGTDEFNGHTFRVWYSNENVISWLDGQPYVMCPDLICIVNDEQCKSLSHFDNNGLQITSGTYDGENVAVLGLPAYKLWRSMKGLEICSPMRFGFDVEYFPIEKVFKKF